MDLDPYIKPSCVFAGPHRTSISSDLILLGIIIGFLISILRLQRVVSVHKVVFLQPQGHFPE